MKEQIERMETSMRPATISALQVLADSVAGGPEPHDSKADPERVYAAVLVGYAHGFKAAVGAATPFTDAAVALEKEIGG